MYKTRNINHRTFSLSQKIFLNDHSYYQSGSDCGNVMVVSSSNNEFSSTKFLDYQLGEKIIYCGQKVSNGYIHPKVYLLAFLFLPLVLIKYFYSASDHKTLYPYLLDQFCLAMAWRYIQRTLMQENKVSTLVYSIICHQ